MVAARGPGASERRRPDAAGVVVHGDHPQLSAQFETTSGDKKSASNLSRGYAAVLWAVRSRLHLKVGRQQS